MINAILLAAGESRRMGQPKPLLRFGDTTFLGQIVAALRLSRVDRITVVLGAEAQRIQGSVDLSGTHVVINGDYREGQLSSLIAGLRNSPPQTDAILVCLVDNPFITTAIVDRIVSRFEQTESPIVVPVCVGKRGHPTLFSKVLFAELLQAPAEQGARYVLHSNTDRISEIEMPEQAVLVHIDTLDDYRTYFGADPETVGPVRP
jgi:molybdenum cofactor cytidylyltransferase